MRDKKQQTVKIELLSQWKLEAEFRNSFANIYSRMSQLYELQIATISVWQ